jgi:gas vesicle protein
MNKWLGVLLSVAVGATAAYMLDPERGRTRRALARDKAIAATNKMSDALDGKSRHWSNVARGYMAEARSLFGRGRGMAEDAASQVRKTV